MSAVTWESAAPVLEPVRPARPRLVSVPTGAEVRGPSVAVRPTRAARLAITLGVALLLAVVAGWLMVAPADAPRAGAVVTVQAGDTLSEIVAAQLPGLDSAVAMAQVRQLNDLPTSQLRAGQVLVLPQP